MIDIKKETAERLKDSIPEKTVFQLFAIGLITEQSAKHFLIHNEFESSAPVRGHKTEIKEVIAEKYCVSYDLVQKIVAKR